MKHVLCYGDSNTWGFTPVTGKRYDEHTRWTGLLQDLLGDAWRVHEAGLNARTSIYDDPFKPYLNGRDMLRGILVSEKPLDVVVLSLGTNDLKFVDAWYAAQGVAALIDIIRTQDAVYPSSQPIFTGEPKVIVVSPIEVDAEIEQREEHSTLKYAHAQSALFSKEFGDMCRQKGVVMVDGAKLAKPSKADCIHMEPEGHRALAQAVAQAIRDVTGESAQRGRKE